MRKLLFFVLLISAAPYLYAQSPLEDILWSNPDFSATIRQGEAYFKARYPGRSFEDLAIGEHRDGDYVKFRRWQSYWSERLNPDGTLGDPMAVQAERKAHSTRRNTNPYTNVSWTNINYTGYITGQIGLGRTTSIGFHPTDANTFYVGAAIGGVWKTTDGGQSYIPLGDDLPFMAVSAIIVNSVDPNTLYIAVSDHVWYGPQGLGVYKSTNGGATWTPTSLSFTFEQNVRIYAMVANPQNDQEMYVATANGLYKTTNGFSSVTRILNSDSRDVRLRPNHSATVYAGLANGRVMKSTNSGVSFSEAANFGNGSILLAVTPLNDQILYARHNNSLHQSTDAGATFPTARTLPENNTVIAISPNSVSTILTGNFECHRSDDGGASFNDISQWLGNNGLPLIHVDQRNLFVNPLENDAVYFCNDGGVYRYNVSTAVFDNLSDGLAITQYYDIAVAQTDANIVGGGSQDNGNVYRQPNGSWLQYASTGDGMNQEIDPSDASIRYWSYQNGGIHRWTNGSNSNIEPPGVGSQGAWETPYKLDPNNPARIVAGYQEVWESFDRGNNWTKISPVLDGGSNMNELAIAPSNGERIYVTSGGNLYVKSTNNDTWTTRSLPSGEVSDIEVDPLDFNKLYVSVPGYSSGSKIYRSTDAGASWTNISGSLPNVSFGALELHFLIPGGIFVGSDAGVFYRDDQLNDWLEYGALPHTRVEDIEIQYDAGLIRVGTHGRGVLEAPIIVEVCTDASPDGDGDGTCDLFDFCPGLDNNLIGSPCDDGDPFSVGELYDAACGCSGGQANLSYCAAEGSPGTGSDYINSVALNGVVRNSDQTQYSDFRETIIPVSINETYTLSVGLRATFAPDRAHAWVDWNRDGVFGPDEHITMDLPLNNISNGSLSVPSNAQEGVTTMRVRVVYSETHNDPCGSAFGEVEDYTLLVNCAAGAGQCAVLPLNWTAFSAVPLQKGSALLRWNTTREENISHFQVERSDDGRTFRPIGQQAGQNAISANYEYIDEDARTNVAYYRIVAVDFDGSESLTPVERVFWADGGTNISLFPNPTDGSGLNVRFSTANEQDVTALVYNSYGQEVSKQLLGAGAGARNVVMATEDLPAGVYLLRLRSKSWDWTGNFVVR